MTGLLADLKFALRTLRRSPLFTGIAILSLALGIGANTAIFTLMDQLMLRLLPVKDPENIVMAYQRGPHNGSNMGDRMNSYPLYQDYQQKAEPFAEVFCRRLAQASMSVDNQTELVQTEMVSGNFFTALGVQPALGRVFNSKEDDQIHNGHPVVVLSYEFWATRFAGDRQIVGKKILVNNYPMTIVGVSSAGFNGLDPSRSPQIRVPIQMKPTIMPTQTWISTGDRRVRWVQVFARLKPGYTAETAEPSVNALFLQIRQYEMTLPAAKDWKEYDRQQFMKGTAKLERAATGYSGLRNRFSKALVVLMCMVGLVLLIACGNVANLLIARAVARQKEIAVRLSIGASRGQLIRQLLVESLLLSAIGGVCGIFLAFWITRGLLALIPTEGNPLLLQPNPDARILLFTIGLSLVTGLIFGLVPALRASRPDLWSTLKDAVGSVAGSGGSVAIRKGLVTVQVALSFLLLFGAGLFVRSLQNLKDTDTGFREIDKLVSFQVAPALNGYSVPRGRQFFQDVQRNLEALPGVTAAGYSAVSLLSSDEWDSSMSVEGHTAQDGEDMQAFMNALSPNYFKAMGIPILEGRDFDSRDQAADESRVCIVNKKFAEHFFKGKSAIGRHVGWGSGPKTKLSIEIVGVVGDSLYEGPREGVHRQVFLPNSGNGSVAFYVRGQNAETLYPPVRAEVKKLDAAMPIYSLRTLGTQLDQTLLTERLIAMLSAGFGGLATLLAAIGLYGVMAFVVARRTKEIGIRMALGAEAGSVVWLVMKEVVLLLAIGLAVGVPAALGLGRYVSTQLYGVKAYDPGVGGIAIVVLVSVAALAGLVPAHRASRIDPLLALRYE